MCGLLTYHLVRGMPFMPPPYYKICGTMYHRLTLRFRGGTSVKNPFGTSPQIHKTIDHPLPWKKNRGRRHTCRACRLACGPGDNQSGDDPGNDLSDDELYRLTNDTIDTVRLCRPSRDISYVRPPYLPPCSRYAFRTTSSL